MGREHVNARLRTLFVEIIIEKNFVMLKSLKV